MNKIVLMFCLTTLLMPSPAWAQAQDEPLSTWAYNAADKLIKSGIIADKSITVDELAKFLISSDTSSSDKPDKPLTEQERIEKIAQILATEKNLKTTTVADADNAMLVKKNALGQSADLTKKAAPVVSIPPLLQRFNERAPEWIYEPLARMNKAGLLSPDDAASLASRDLNRREAAILTARAYNLNKQNSIINVPAYLHSNSYDSNVDNQVIAADIESLMQEFNTEIQALGYGAGKGSFAKKPKDPVDNSLKIKGEVRYNVMTNHSASDKYNWSDHRVRTRIYMDQAIDSNWTAHGMVESDKSFAGSNTNSAYYTKDKDGKVSLGRYYVTGKAYLFNLPVDVDAGQTSAYLGDGNILDSNFRGVKLSTFGADQGNRSTLYNFGYGQVNDTQNTFYIEAHHTTYNDLDYSAGFYRWNNYGTPVGIYSLGSNYYVANYTLGAMYLKASEADKGNSSNGYVLTAKYGYNRSWIPGTYEIDAHYYNMAGTTYINPTMSNLGSYMNGFKGYGAAWYYTVTPSILLGLEYYDLKDKISLVDVRTWWGQVSYNF